MTTLPQVVDNLPLKMILPQRQSGLKILKSKLHSSHLLTQLVTMVEEQPNTFWKLWGPKSTLSNADGDEVALQEFLDK